DAPTLGFRQVDRLCGFRWNLVPLAMQLVIFDFFYSHRLKGAESDVQRDLGNFNPACTNLLQDLRREMQAGGWRCHRSCGRSRRLGIHRLVTVAVRWPVVAVDIRRKRHVSNALDAGKEIGDRSEANAALAKTAATDDFGFDLGFQCGWVVFGWIAHTWIAGCTAKVEFFSDPDLAPGPYQTFPLIRILRHLACEQNFDPPAEKISGRWILRA